MPTYLYECENCGRFEEFQKITADPLSECPDCRGEVKRIIGAPGIIFKGSGFYSTDAKSSSNTINSTDTSSDKTDKTKNEKTAKAETKEPETKEDNKEKAS
ncbi:MAG: FmdB family zinc ribbon protein [Halanaerobiales bacterium]